LHINTYFVAHCIYDRGRTDGGKCAAFPYNACSDSGGRVIARAADDKRAFGKAGGSGGGLMHLTRYACALMHRSKQ
jgi:hypothetical protein